MLFPRVAAFVFLLLYVLEALILLLLLLLAPAEGTVFGQIVEEDRCNDDDEEACLLVRVLATRNDDNGVGNAEEEGDIAAAWLVLCRLCFIASVGVRGWYFNVVGMSKLCQ